MKAPLELLLVDDNPGDVRLTREALAEAGLAAGLSVAGDGEQALSLLRSRPLPDLVILDLNLPRLDGRRVLAALRADPALRDLPVFVLTTSKADREALRQFEGPLFRYIVKPRDIEHFIAVVRGLADFLRAARGAARP